VLLFPDGEIFMSLLEIQIVHTLEALLDLGRRYGMGHGPGS
jgi:hypothetical protein